ncbi:hypothetical protein SODALDRAFT_358992 [Sodiomyces alkalinus F11]|uniref:Uncharacterized protein n=1 Tax=Sodiomyces alkalinus (strain CBS 110278 / VKM F-3762 / F11) TaxID=1314773 RepID=A0A3N2PXI0_SODAK|nr:hypothetical protein SODALDRAFT_358992 [Sodiomyces alkalinus F11]ROT39126.1 hypothetical protein SODALDRAFT_358992 [Sodiomyces alkalinus F11]
MQSKATQLPIANCQPLLPEILQLNRVDLDPASSPGYIVSTVSGTAAAGPQIDASSPHLSSAFALCRRRLAGTLVLMTAVPPGIKRPEQAQYYPGSWPCSESSVDQQRSGLSIGKPPRNPSSALALLMLRPPFILLGEVMPRADIHIHPYGGSPDTILRETHGMALMVQCRSQSGSPSAAQLPSAVGNPVRTLPFLPRRMHAKFPLDVHSQFGESRPSLSVHLVHGTHA